MRRNKELKDKNIIVTGGKGFVGQALVKCLKSEGANVAIIDMSLGQDICDWSRLKKFKRFKRIDIVYHLAAISYVPFSWQNPRRTYEVNVLGTLNVLEFCRQKKVGKMVFMSSYVYGRPQYLPIDEQHRLEPSNPYAASKLAGEELCRAYARDFGLAVVILRPFNIYGIGQNQDFLIPTVVSQVGASASVTLNDLRPKRDFIYLADVVDALVLAGRYGADRIEVFNIGSGKSHSIKELLLMIEALKGRRLRVHNRGLRRRGEVLDVRASISRAKNKLGWRPSTSLKQGLALIWQSQEKES